MAGEFGPFLAKMERLQREVGGEGQRRMLDVLGKGAKQDVEAAVHGDLGDLSMSRWWPGHPGQIEGRYDVKGDTVEVTPTPRSRGRFRVLEDGRRGGGSHDLVLVGRVRRDGTRRARSRGRSSGATRGKGTWTDATNRIARETPKRAELEFVKSIKRVF